MPVVQRPASLQVLLVEDDENDAALLEHHLTREGYTLETRRVFTLHDLDAALQENRWDVVISDYLLPGFTAADALHSVISLCENTPFIVVSGMLDEETACRMMQAGAQDYLRKDRLDRLAPVIERERREARIRQERRAALEAVSANELRFRTLSANIPGVLFQMRQIGRGAPSFLFVSEASMMLMGVPAGELMRRQDPVLDFVLPDDRSSLESALLDAGSRGATLNWEGRILASGADIKWVNMRCSPRSLDDATLLWEGAMWNITHSKVTEAELRASRAQLAELSEHLQRVKEEERDRIARDIHDVLGGTLVGIKISAKLLAGKLGKNEPLLLDHIADIETMLDDAISTAGRVARELRPGILKEFGLAAAIESYAEDYSHRVGIPCSVLCADYDIETGEDTALALFRTYQEALTNISKHAGASHVEIRLMQEDDEIVLEISDDGRGLAEQDLRKPKSFGLRSIRERLNGLGGRMELQNRTPRGTTVTLRAPAHPAALQAKAELSRLQAGTNRNQNNGPTQ